jgi:hypothetical protein
MSSISRWYTNRAIAFLILLIPMMGYLFYHAYLYRNREVVSETQALAIVQETAFRGSGNGKHFKTTLALPKGGTIILQLAPSPAPRAGDQIPLTEITRASGQVDYRLNREAWNRLRAAAEQP